MQFEVDIDGTLRHVVVHRVNGRFQVEIDGRISLVDAERVDSRTLSLLLSDGSDQPGGSSYEVTVVPAASGQVDVQLRGSRVMLSLDGRRRWRRDETVTSNGPERLVAPMPGKVVRVLVKPGEAVHARQPLVVMEAMKMENELRASRDGVVSEVHVREGQSVDAGSLVVVVGDSA